MGESIFGFYILICRSIKEDKNLREVFCCNKYCFAKEISPINDQQEEKYTFIYCCWYQILLYTIYEKKKMSTDKNLEIKDPKKSIFRKVYVSVFSRTYNSVEFKCQGFDIRKMIRKFYRIKAKKVNIRRRWYGHATYCFKMPLAISAS